MAFRSIFGALACVVALSGCHANGGASPDASTGDGGVMCGANTATQRCTACTRVLATCENEYPNPCMEMDASLASCSDDALSLTQTCCLPQGSRVCFGVGGSCNPHCGGTCADAKCDLYAGSTLTGCSDLPENTGYVATCCFEPTQPVCIPSFSSSEGCYLPDGGQIYLPPLVTKCSDRPAPCAEYPGSYLASCDDTSNIAQCCWPPGTMPSRAFSVGCPDGTSTSPPSLNHDSGP